MKVGKNERIWTIVFLTLMTVCLIIDVLALILGLDYVFQVNTPVRNVVESDSTVVHVITGRPKAKPERKITEADLLMRDDRIAELEKLLADKDAEIEDLLYDLEYYDTMTEYVYNGEWSYYYDETDVEILAGVMYGENWISGRYEMMLTGSVVLNRVMDKRFPNNIHDVIYQIDGGYEQYAPRTKRLIGSSEVPDICYDLARMLLEYGPIAPPDVVYQAHFNQGEIFWDYKGEQFCFG